MIERVTQLDFDIKGSDKAMSESCEPGGLSNTEISTV